MKAVDETTPRCSALSTSRSGPTPSPTNGRWHLRPPPCCECCAQLLCSSPSVARPYGVSRDCQVDCDGTLLIQAGWLHLHHQSTTWQWQSHSGFQISQTDWPQALHKGNNNKQRDKKQCTYSIYHIDIIYYMCAYVLVFVAASLERMMENHNPGQMAEKIPRRRPPNCVGWTKRDAEGKLKF